MARPKAKAKPKAAKRTPRKPAKAKLRAQDTCFVLSPFGDWYDRYYDDVYAPAIRQANLEPKRADSLFTSGDVVQRIWTYVQEARVILADLSGANPNVYYELGLAHATRKPVLLIARDINEVPFDLQQLNVGLYDTLSPSWADDLRKKISAGLKETIRSPNKQVLPTFLSTEGAPAVAPQEKINRQLQSQVNALRAQVQSMSRPGLATSWPSPRPFALGVKGAHVVSSRDILSLPVMGGGVVTFDTATGEMKELGKSTGD